MDRTVPYDDRNPFFPSEQQSTLGLTLSLVLTLLTCTVLAGAMLIAQLDALGPHRSHPLSLSPTSQPAPTNMLRPTLTFDAASSDGRCVVANNPSASRAY